MADILVLNAGSSTLKYRLLRGDTTLAGGLVERIGEPGVTRPTTPARSNVYWIACTAS